MTYTTQQMRNMIAFMRLNIRNFDDGVGDEAQAYLTNALNMFEDAVNQLDAVPVEAIEVLRFNAVPDYWIEYAEECKGPAAEMLHAVDRWLETQVTP